MALIGQFGVGFYSAFMVADRSRSCRARPAKAKRGAGLRTARASSPSSRREGAPRHHHHLDLHEGDERNFSSPTALRGSSRPIPTISRCRSCSSRGGKKETSMPPRRCGCGPRARSRRAIQGILPRRRAQFDEPWLTIHAKAEGTLEYTRLLFVPSTKPFDLFEPARKTGSNSMSAASSSPRTCRSCCRPICASSRASSIARTCR